MLTKQQVAHRVPEQIVIAAIIEPERDFVQIRWQMLGTDLVVCADQTAFQKTPNIFNGIDVHLAAGSVFGFVKRLVLGKLANAVVALKRICNDHVDVFAQFFLDKLSQGFPVHFRQCFHADFAAAFNHADNASLTRRSTSTLAGLCSAHEGFIHFNRSVQQGFILHGIADAMAQIPRRLVGYAQGALHLVCRHALFGFAHEIDRKKPFPKRQVRIVKNASRRDGELVTTVVAVVLAALLDLRDALRFTARTTRAIRPAYFSQIIPAFVLAVKVLNELNQICVHKIYE